MFEVFISFEELFLLTWSSLSISIWFNHHRIKTERIKQQKAQTLIHMCWIFSNHMVNRLLQRISVTANWQKSQNGTLFSHVWRRAGWHLIPYRNKSCSEFFSQADKNWHIMWGNNLGPDWPPLAKGSKISHYHTPTRPLNFFPFDNRRIRAYRSEL